MGVCDGTLANVALAQVGTSYQPDSGTTGHWQLGLVAGNWEESSKDVRITLATHGYVNDARENFVVTKLGVDVWKDASTIDTALGGSTSREETYSWAYIPGEWYSSDYTVSIWKRDYAQKVVPWTCLTGIYYGTDMWTAGNFWVWGNEYGVIDMRTTDTSKCQLKKAADTYGGKGGMSSWVVYGGKSRVAGGYSNATITIPAKSLPIYAVNPSGVYKMATHVYVYDSSGKPREAKAATVYDSSGKPHTTAWR